MNIDHPLRWCVVHTGYHQEKVARDAIARLGLQPFLPLLRKEVVRRKRLSLKQRKDPNNVSVSERPLFPRYVLAHVDLRSDVWENLFRSAGVAGLVMDGLHPARVPDAVVDELRRRDDVVERMRPPGPGDQVRIGRGAFGGTLATIERCDELGRISLLFEAMGRKVRLVLSNDQVIPA